MRPFTDLKVWQRAHQLVLAIYRVTASFPADERFGLTSQIRRAAVSVPNNLAEGSRRRTDNDFAHRINIAEGSMAEVEYLLILSRDLGHISGAAAEKLLDEATQIGRMLYVLRRRVDPPSD